MKPYRIVVFGSRTLLDFDLVHQKVGDFIEQITGVPMGNMDKSQLQIVTGGQKSYNKEMNHYYGADYYGEQFAKIHGFEHILFPADWNQYHLKAGPMRNTDMARYGNYGIGFWDGVSKGTRDMAHKAMMHFIETRIITFKPVEIVTSVKQQDEIWVPRSDKPIQEEY